MRMLYVKGGFIVNVVEYPIPADAPERGDDGEDVVPTVTGVENVGDAFDVTDTLRERRVDKMEQAILQELFRLTNAVRTLNGQATISGAQYRTFFKDLM